MLSLRGKNNTLVKRHLAKTNQQHIDLEPSKISNVTVLPLEQLYKHMGGYLDKDHNLAVELSHKAALIRQSYSQLKRKYIANQHIPHHKRLIIAQPRDHLSMKHRCV